MSDEDVKLLEHKPACEKEGCEAVDKADCEACEVPEEKPKKRTRKKKKVEPKVLKLEQDLPAKSAPSQTKVKMAKIRGEKSRLAQKYYPRKNKH